MKKVLSVILATLATIPVFCGCSSAERQATADATEAPREITPTPEPVKPAPPESKSIEIFIDDGFTCRRSPIFGVRKRFARLDGEYSVEYIHTPYGIAHDETLSYNISLNADNTYAMTVVADGVTSAHNGRWYETCGGITFFFDESIDPPAHNEYVADSMYAETLPHGKLMIYEGGHTIVLSRSAQDAEFDEVKERKAIA